MFKWCVHIWHWKMLVYHLPSFQPWFNHIFLPWKQHVVRVSMIFHWFSHCFNIFLPLIVDNVSCCNPFYPLIWWWFSMDFYDFPKKFLFPILFPTIPLTFHGSVQQKMTRGPSRLARAPARHGRAHRPRGPITRQLFRRGKPPFFMGKTDTKTWEKVWKKDGKLENGKFRMVEKRHVEGWMQSQV